MGCVSSKGFRRNPDRVSWYSPMSRNVSAASTNRRFESEEEFNHVVSLTSSSYGELNTATYMGSFLNLGRRAKQYKTLSPCTEFEDSFTFTSHLDVKHKGVCAATKPEMHKEQRNCLLMDDNTEGCPLMCHESKRYGTEIINTWELMDGLEDGARSSSSLRSQSCGKLIIPDKQISSSKLQGSINEPMGDGGSPVWKKYYMQEDEIVSMDFSFAQNSNTPPIGSPFSESPRRPYTPVTGSPFSESPRWAHTPLSGSPFSQSPRKEPSRGSLMDIEDSRSISSIELLDASTIGLKFLVSPANSSFHPSPVTGKEGLHSASRSFDARSSHSAHASFDGNNAHLRAYFDDTKSSYRSPNTTRHSSKKPSTESVYGSGSPLFDPSLMATFEEALKATKESASYDEWLQFSTDGSTMFSSSSADTQTSFDTLSDAESTPLWENREKLSLKIMPIDEGEVKSKKDLASYDFKCPARGEGKVVLYVTSLRGIRKTYQDCCNLRLILRGLGVQVDERDVWMHSKFRSELMDVLSGLSRGVPQVPQLFIKGRYIGGAEEVKQLHEEGILACLMDGLATGLIHNVCDGCGDARFVPCFNCNGSCKVLNEDNEVLRCLDCNENGLIMCPMCNI